MKVLKIYTDSNCLTVNPHEGMSFMSFIHSVISFGGFTDGVSMWVPLKEIKSVQYVEQETIIMDTSTPMVKQ